MALVNQGHPAKRLKQSHSLLDLPANSLVLVLKYCWTSEYHSVLVRVCSHFKQAILTQDFLRDVPMAFIPGRAPFLLFDYQVLPSKMLSQTLLAIYRKTTLRQVPIRLRSLGTAFYCVVFILFIVELHKRRYDLNPCENITNIAEISSLFSMSLKKLMVVAQGFSPWPLLIERAGAWYFRCFDFPDLAQYPPELEAPLLKSFSRDFLAKKIKAFYLGHDFPSFFGRVAQSPNGRLWLGQLVEKARFRRSNNEYLVREMLKALLGTRIPDFNFIIFHSSRMCVDQLILERLLELAPVSVLATQANWWNQTFKRKDQAIAYLGKIGLRQADYYGFRFDLVERLPFIETKEQLKASWVYENYSETRTILAGLPQHKLWDPSDKDLLTRYFLWSFRAEVAGQELVQLAQPLAWPIDITLLFIGKPNWFRLLEYICCYPDQVCFKLEPIQVQLDNRLLALAYAWLVATYPTAFEQFAFLHSIVKPHLLADIKVCIDKAKPIIIGKYEITASSRWNLFWQILRTESTPSSTDYQKALNCDHCRQQFRELFSTEVQRLTEHLRVEEFIESVIN